MKKTSMEKLLFFCGIFVLNFLFIDSGMIRFYQLHNSICVNDGNICDPKDKKPCCDSELVCKLTDLMRNAFTCTNKVKLGQSCETNEDCNEYIPRAECSKQKKCVCRPGSIQMNEMSCLPLLGEFCVDNEICEAKNSICFDNLCQCDDGYLPYNHIICLPILLGTYCKNNTDCEAVTHTKCSKEKFCTCKEYAVEINPSRCDVTPDFFCESNSQCEKNKFCNNYKCQCKSGFRLESDHECIPVRLGMSCEIDEDCSNLMKHSICSAEKKCECDRFHYPTEDVLCASIINDACKNSELCKNEFILCVDDKCHCQPNYVYDGSKCVPAPKN